MLSIPHRQRSPAIRTKATDWSMASWTRFSRARRRPADLIDRGAFVALQPSQRAIQVDVGGVKEFEHSFRGKLRPRGSVQDGNSQYSGLRFHILPAKSLEIRALVGRKAAISATWQRNLFRCPVFFRQRNKFRSTKSWRVLAFPRHFRLE